MIRETSSAGISSTGIHWRHPASSDDDGHKVASMLSDNIIHQQEVSPHLPLVWMFLNKNKSASVEDVSSSSEHEADSAERPSSHKVPDSVDSPPTTSNQISPLESHWSTTPSASAVVNPEDQALQAQLSALLNAHSEAAAAVPTSTGPPTSTIRQPPTRKSPAVKRPRPKPSTTTTTTPASHPVTEEESLSEQQANVLQFLVSNPPAWVLDEIINGSTMTTWFPLPIPGKPTSPPPFFPH